MVFKINLLKVRGIYQTGSVLFSLFLVPQSRVQLMVRGVLYIAAHSH